MFAKWRQKREENRAKSKAIAESQYWKEHAPLRVCLQVMRGSCTVAPVEMHEAAIAAVNIAMQENSWTAAEAVPDDFFTGQIFLVWDDEKLPVLTAPGALAEHCLTDLRAVADQTFLLSQSLERIVWFRRDGQIMLYSIA